MDNPALIPTDVERKLAEFVLDQHAEFNDDVDRAKLLEGHALDDHLDHLKERHVDLVFSAVDAFLKAQKGEEFA